MIALTNFSAFVACRRSHYPTRPPATWTSWPRSSTTCGTKRTARAHARSASSGLLATRRQRARRKEPGQQLKRFRKAYSRFAWEALGIGWYSRKLLYANFRVDTEGLNMFVYFCFMAHIKTSWSCIAINRYFCLPPRTSRRPRASRPHQDLRRNKVSQCWHLFISVSIAFSYAPFLFFWLILYMYTVFILSQHHAEIV